MPTSNLVVLPPVGLSDLPQEVPIVLVGGNGRDLCIICGEDTGVPATVPVDLRNNYVHGAGQLCPKCAVELDLNDTAL